MKRKRRVSLAVKINLLIIAGILLVSSMVVGLSYRTHCKRIDNSYNEQAVRADVDEFVGDAEQFDDFTMLCLLYKGGNHEETDCQSGEADHRNLSEK